MWRNTESICIAHHLLSYNPRHTERYYRPYLVSYTDFYRIPGTSVLIMLCHTMAKEFTHWSIHIEFMHKSIHMKFPSSWSNVALMSLAVVVLHWRHIKAESHWWRLYLRQTPLFGCIDRHTDRRTMVNSILPLPHGVRAGDKKDGSSIVDYVITTLGIF